MGIYQVPFWFSILLTIFTILVIINAYNLIDGIDGLAGGIGAIASFTFGLWFYNYNQFSLCILSFSLFSALLAFLVYNFSPANIFMGDTGSLVVGIILAVLTVNFVELSFDSTPFEFPFRSSPAMAIAILIYPLTDLMRVFMIRLIKRRSPFHADRNHIHHFLLDLGLTHREVSLTLYLVNIGFILLALTMRNVSSLALLIILMGLSFLLSIAPYLYKAFIRDKSGKIDIAN